jgi:flagellar assembly protein FliH/type III secretion protein L
MIRSRALALAEESRQQAESGAQKVRNQARDEGYASGLADAAARVLFLAQLEADADARQLERTVGLARLLAERLLGKALELDASVAASLAQQALAEVRGASRVTLFVSPADQQTIARSLDAPSYTQAAVELRTDDALASGHFRLQTNIGTLDAALGSRLALLGDKLREGLKK